MSATSDPRERQLEELGLRLPPARQPTNVNRVAALRVGQLLFVSGHGPVETGGAGTYGQAGGEVTVEEARRAAEGCALNMLSTIREALGGLDAVRRVVKILAFVNSAVGFDQQPAVADGASDVFLALWGDAGRHTRSAVGVSALPRGRVVEVEGIFEVADG